MKVCPAIPLVAVLAAAPLQPAHAQFGGMPGLPGSAPAPGFGAPQQGPPPACQQLLTLRDDAQKHAAAIQAANQRHAAPEQACRLFKVFLAAEAKMIKAVDEHSATCGVPANVSKQMKAGHTRTEQIAKQVCDVAAMGPRPAGPSLSDALGTTPPVPDSTKRRGGTFDTLTGNALTR